MRLPMILPAALAGLAFARPQGGSMNVLGFCHTHTQACSYTSLYDCTNRGGHSQYFCINTCACENKYQPPKMQAPVPPKPSPLPLDKSGEKGGSPSEDTSPEGANPEDLTPDDMAPEDTSTENTSPETTSPEDVNPGESIPEDTTSEDTAPEDTSTEDTSPETTSSEDTTPED